MLINDWTRGVKETNSEYVEIKKRKQEIIDDLYLGSMTANFFGALRFLDIYYLPFFVPYKERLCFLFATPWVSKLPLKI